MSTPIESVVRTAHSPAQAKIYVAMLMAKGIPARIDGDTLTDEFAASRRLMNLLGTEVMVPTKSLELAREILQPANIAPEELERQALAEPRMTIMPSAAAASGNGAASPWWSWVARVLLLLLLVLLALLGSM